MTGSLQRPSEPRVKRVAGETTPESSSESNLGLPVACPELVHGPLGHMWLRGIGYERLRSELADGYYPDDTVNP